MGRRPKQTFLQRQHTDSQQTHEKMFNITKYQRNTNQNYNEISPHTSQNSHHQKKCQRVNVQSVEKREPSYTIGGNVSLYSHLGEQYVDVVLVTKLCSTL